MTTLCHKLFEKGLCLRKFPLWKIVRPPWKEGEIRLEVDRTLPWAHLKIIIMNSLLPNPAPSEITGRDQTSANTLTWYCHSSKIRRFVILRPRTITYFLRLLLDLDTRALVFASTTNLEGGPSFAKIWLRQLQPEPARRPHGTENFYIKIIWKKYHI